MRCAARPERCRPRSTKTQTGDYWYKYYGGFRDPASGQMLGGSAVFGLEDNVNYFGLDGKHNNNMRATYETFGKIATENYPLLFKDNPIPPYKEAVDTSFIFGAQALLNTGGVQGASAETVDYAKEAQSGQVLGHKAVYINFASGSDQPLPDSLPTLSELKDSLAINSQLALQIDGYTDNAGSDAVNVPLSEKRAQAVKHYFQQVAPLSFPDSRFKSGRRPRLAESHCLERIGRRQGSQSQSRDHADRAVVSSGRRKPPDPFHHGQIMNHALAVFSPNAVLNKNAVRALIAVQIAHRDPVMDLQPLCSAAQAGRGSAAPLASCGSRAWARS